MVELWYFIVALMLTLYVVMDGFDLGAGALHLFVARTNEERRQVLAAIGPYWDGNEVWLLATGGALFVAFPPVLAAGLSGFYFAIFLVLWSLILRGISIEFRSHVVDPIWRSLWDTGLGVASLLLAVFFGAALGNLLRGLPLDDRGWFSLALFTDFSARAPVGILDWYTVLVGLFALVALMLHGALFLAWKTDGPVYERSIALARKLVIVMVAGWVLVTIGTVKVQPTFFAAFASRPLAWVAISAAIAGVGAIVRSLRTQQWLAAFTGSTVFLGGLLVATAITIFPVMLLSVGDPSHSITAYAAANDAHGLRTALGWWIVGFPLEILFFVLVFRL